MGNELWNLTLGKPNLDDQGAKILKRRTEAMRALQHRILRIGVEGHLACET